MDKLASTIRKRLNPLAREYQQRLQGIEPYAQMPSAERLKVARSDLLLVADCLEAPDDGPRQALIRTHAVGRVEQGISPHSLSLALSDLEETLQPLTSDLETARALWRVLFQTYAAAAQTAVERIAQRVERPTLESERKFGEMVSRAAIGFFRTTVAGQIVDANPALLRLLRFDSVEQANEVGLLNLYVDPTDRQRLIAALQQGPVSGFETRFRRGDGEIIDISVGAHLEFDERGNPQYIEGTLEDITERKQVEQILEEQRAFLRQIIDINPHFIFVKDREGRFVLVNQALAEAYGSTPDGLVGKSDADFNPNVEEVEAFHRDDLEVMDTGREKFIPEEPITDSTGRLRWLQTIKRPMVDKDGVVRHLVGVATDITERKRVEEQLRALLERRGYQVQISAEIAQAIAAAPALDELFRRVVTAIKERLGYYHAQIFRYEPALNAMVLVAGYGEAGERMLARGHRLEMNVGVVGTAATTGQAVLASDVTTDRNWQPNPDLPDTKGELAVPIRLGEEVLGILDVQSDQAGALTLEDQVMLENISALIALAIEDTRLRQEMEERLRELDAVYRATSEAGWQAFWSTGKMTTGYLFDRTAVRPVKDLWLPEIAQAVTQKTPITPAPDQPIAVTPLSVRGEVIGALGVYDDPLHPLTSDDLALIEQVSEQGALALESARLFEQTQLALAETAALYQASANLNSATTYDEILDALRNHTLLGGADLVVAIILFEKPWTAQERPEWAIPVARRANLPPGVLSPRYPLSLFPAAAQLLRQEAPTLISSIADDPRLDESSRALFGQRFGAHSLAVVPLMVGRDTIGFVQGSFSQQTQFPEDAVRRLVALSGQAAIAVESIRRLEQVERSLEEAEALYRASRAIGEATSLEEIARGAAEVGASLTMNFCSLTLITTTDEAGLPLRGDVYPVDITPDGCHARPAIADWEMEDRATAHQIAIDPAAILTFTDIENPQANISAEARKWLRSIGMRGGAITGLTVRGRLAGLLAFASTSAVTEMPLEHTRRIRTIADQVSVAIENRLLLEETRRRATQLETAADVSSAASSLLNLDELLPQAVELIRQRFDFYYVGVFLLDESGQWAVLRAGTGEAGQRMLETGHRLEVGGASMIGQAIARGEPRIAFDVGEEAVRFDNPLLPETRSEMALPLVSRGRPIGAMTIQATQPLAFAAEDITVLRTMADQLSNAIENARLFSEIERALLETRDLFEAGRAIGAAASAEEVAQALVEYAARASLDVARILLFERSGDRVTHVVMSESWTVDNRPVHPTGTRLPVDEFALFGLTQATETVVVEDIHADPRVDEGMRIMMEVIRLRSFALIPMSIGQRQIGMLLVGRDLPSSYPEKTIRNLWTLCGQAAIAVENLRLLEETRRRAQELEAINEMGRTITSVLDPDVLLRQIADTTKSRFGHDYVSILLVEGENRLVLADGSTIGNSDRRLTPRSAVFDLRRPGILTDAVRTGQPVLVNDVLSDPRYTTVPELSATRAQLVVPLEVKGHIIGVLNVERNRPYSFDQTDVLLLQSLASQAAVAIENARLFADTEAEARRRSLIGEVLQAAATSMEPEDLLHRAGEAISRNMEIPSAILLWEPAEDAFRVIAIHSAEAEDAPVPADLRVTREMDPTLFTVLERRRPQFLDMTGGPLSSPLSGVAAHAGLRSAIYVPLTSRDQVLGVLALGRSEEQHPITPERVSFAEIVAANLSVALENARLYQEAVQTAERLAEVDRLKSQFLANMSHELRTPLNSIIGFSRVILKGIDGPLTDLQRQDLEAIYSSGQHLLNLINDILDISKVEAGKMELAFEPTNVTEIIHSVMSTATALVKDKPIQLETDIPEELPVIIADNRRVHQILLNLVSNAAKFTEQGFIRVSAHADDEFVTISVSDSGIGIPPDKLDNVFVAFTQVDASATRRFGGTGLGLAISRSFVELHGGRIWAESKVGEGSCFSFSLPIKGPHPPEEPAPPPAAGEEAEKPGARIVLCVDDDEGVITLFRRYLDKQGYHVIGLTDPYRVVEEAQRLQPFAITLDVMMPGKDGWQVIHELKANPSTRAIPVVMCTIVSEQGRGMSLGAADYLVKPILEQDLLAALDRLDREAGRHRVLVVDDQPDDRALLRRIVEGQDGYEVIEAAGGQEAIALVGQIHPDIIILDLLMPEVDGFAVLEALKMNETTRFIPIIVVTAKDLTEGDRLVLNDRIEALVHKGVLEQEELLEDVAAALRKVSHVVGRK